MELNPANLKIALVLAVGALTVWAVWVAAVAYRYRIKAAPPVRHRVRCEDGWALTVYERRAAVRRYAEPIILCHGFAANRYTFDFEPPHSIAHHLADAGFDCYTVELRGTGASRWAPSLRQYGSFSIDDHIRQDAPALLRFALEKSGAQQAFWFGHSMGALVGYALAQGEDGGRLRGLCALGAPVFFERDALLRFAVQLGALAAWPFGVRQRLFSLTIAPFLGHVTLPLSDVIVNPKAIPAPLQRKVYAHLISTMGRRVLLQFRDWILNDAFRSWDQQHDYRAGLERLSIPLLVMGGSSDRMAPPSVVRRQFEALKSPDKTLMLFGQESGDSLDYGHGDLLYGAAAPHEVYPRFTAWLQQRASPPA